MAEAIRLVIWDLDDTLWQGTITEGGITAHNPEYYETIRELARRGIISSVCSKNDFDTVRAILVEQGIWDFFVFPSVTWSPKGARLKQMIEAIGLRPATVLFIDDNPGNRGEAAACVPGLQIADETIIPTLLRDTRCLGKDDSVLSRLTQYKLLEKKQRDQARAGGDNAAFLRTSHIRVVIENDVEGNLDRAIELVNRTNQLNFTKIRLGEDLGIARSELRDEISAFNRQAGLIKVIDDYGDYGFVGFFCVQTTGNYKVARHFCFSCRTIGMGIERWVYDLLQRPKLKLVGEVLTDLNAGDSVDWIGLSSEMDPSKPPIKKTSGEIRIRGGCELDALVHYFNLHADRVLSETNLVRKHLFVRKNATSQLPQIGFSAPHVVEEAMRLGFAREDLSSRLFAPPTADDTYLILSFWADRSFHHYRNRKFGFTIACNLSQGQIFDLTKITMEQMTDQDREMKFSPDLLDDVIRYVDIMKSDYEFLGRLSPEVIERNTRLVLNSIPAGVRTFFIIPSAYSFSTHNGKQALPWSEGYEAMIANIVSSYPSIVFIKMDEIIRGDDERLPGNDHFVRQVYHRLFLQISQTIEGFRAARKVPAGIAPAKLDPARNPAMLSPVDGA